MIWDVSWTYVLILILVVGGRVPKMDEDTLEILSEESIIVYISYLDQLKHLFVSFIHNNFNAGKKVIIYLIIYHVSLLTGKK